LRSPSLIRPLLGGYLIFVALVLGAGTAVTLYVRSQLQAQVQAADLALAQAVALELDNKLQGAQTALAEVSRLDEVRSGDLAAISYVLRAFKAARQDTDSVYWLDQHGILQVSVPSSPRTAGIDYSGEQIFTSAQQSGQPLIVAGVVDLTTFNPVAALGHPVYSADGAFRGVVAANVLLDELSAPLRTIVQEQGRPLYIQVINAAGVLVATNDRARLLQPMLTEIPNAQAALAGMPTTSLGRGRDGSMWLFSAEPVASAGWAVVVQRHTSDAFAVISDFNRWLSALALLFAVGGVFFWLLLHAQVIRPLRTMARHNENWPLDTLLPDALAEPLLRRTDEVGTLARSQRELRHAIARRLTELQTLLATSTAVVESLDPKAVAQQIMLAVRRLVDVQAVAVLVPDDQGVLKVLVSDGHTGHARHPLMIEPDSPHSPSALAMREGRPVQLIADADPHFPTISSDAGFRALLAVPISGSHVGGVVLTVYRRTAQPFSPDEINLLLAFANHATLAWEHAVLYERSDERLREIARENAQLYREAAHERQLLAALMRSMDEGLVLANDDGLILYANRSAATLIGRADADLMHSTLAELYTALQARAIPHSTDPTAPPTLVAIPQPERTRWIALREFAVGDETGRVIGRGLLLRDVTTEHELDQFKTTLLGAVGHELRTPLAAIKGHASTLLQPDVRWSEADQHHFLRTINDEADRLTRLTRSLLDLSRVEAGLLILERAPWRLGDLLTLVLRRYTADVGQRILVDLPADLPPLDVDPQRIDVVLDNLISNALRYGGEQIMISANASPEGVQMMISDDGASLTDADLPYVFERFYRSGQAAQRHVGGTGLGLAICRAFVEAHHGRIWAERTATQTIFHVLLPTATVFVVREPVTS
jgi:signal transduction histidine kinase